VAAKRARRVMFDPDLLLDFLFPFAPNGRPQVRKVLADSWPAHSTANPKMGLSQNWGISSKYQFQRVVVSFR